MDRHDITLILNALGDECLLPWDVMNTAILTLSTVQSCREHQHVVVTLESSLHHTWEVATVTPRLVDANAHRLQTRKIEQQVVDQISELALIMGTDDGAKCHTVLSAQGWLDTNVYSFPSFLLGRFSMPTISISILRYFTHSVNHSVPDR